jgi:quercetin dioxygenase-like cupin family protein
MEIGTSPQRWALADMKARLVRYAELKPCYNAFIDTRTPGSESKENFTIIGPGVSENPNQYVHITEPHGFNIGGARQPPGCVNSQHSHDTVEVFVVHTGTWSFNIGEHGDDAKVICHPGDVISLPTGMFRGFTNIGDDVGFLWAVLGGDDPGRVLWAPQVFEMAKNYGLVLLEDGQLVDTVAGENIPPGLAKMPATTPQQVAMLHVPDQTEAEALVWRIEQGHKGVQRVIGPGASFDWPHPFTLDYLANAEERATPGTPEVIFVHEGTARIAWNGGSLTLDRGDTMSMPIGLERSLTCTGIVFRVLGSPA